MSYRVMIDDVILCSPNAEETALIDPIVTLEINKAGTFSFTMLPDHPFYDEIEMRKSIIDVYQDDELLFEGIPVSVKTDFWNRKTVSCEGELTFLNDTIQRPARYQNQTINTLLGAYLTEHNSQADLTKQFQLGTITVTGAGGNIFRYTNWQNTLTEINEDLVQNYGGFLRVRHDQGVRYLDYLGSSPRTSTQVIRIGKNLVDLSKNLSTLDICTVLIPLGTKLDTPEIEGLDAYLTIKSVNSNLDYLVGSAAATYGNVWKTVRWDDITTASALKDKGEEYLDDIQWANLVIEAEAVDLGLAGEDVQQFQILDQIRVVSAPHGIDRYFILSKLKIDLNHPGKTKITLGMETTMPLSTQTSSVQKEIQQTQTNIIADASENARQILESATGGNIYFVYDSNGVCTEIRIMDTNDPATATKIWRWNINGWGYSGDGGQTYTVAATMNGAIIADFITAGTLQGIEVIADQGNIAGWDISANGFSKTVTDPNDSTKKYRVMMYTPNSSTPGTSPVFDFQMSTDAGNTWEQLFYIPGNGSMTVYSASSRGDSRINIVESATPTNRTYINSNGIRIHRDVSYSDVTDANLYSTQLEFRDDNNVLRAYLGYMGSLFYDANGQLVSSYWNTGWTEFNVQDLYADGGIAHWRCLFNGRFMMAVCRREFSNVVVNYPWGNIYCGTGNGSDCNFKSVGYPLSFQSAPVVIAQLDAPNSGNDGWLVTNAMWTQANQTGYTPAYDLARGTSGTVPSIAINYLVFGYYVLTFSVTNTLTNVTNSNAATYVTEGDSYNATLTPATGYVMDSVVITMDGVDVTEDSYTPETGEVSIYGVSGAIVITATAVTDPDNPGGD